MAQDGDTKEAMRNHFIKMMEKAAAEQARERIEAHLKFCETWYEGEWTVDLIDTAVMESYGSIGQRVLREAVNG